MSKYIKSMIEEGRQIMLKENKLRALAGLGEISSKDDMFYYNIGRYKYCGNDLIIDCLKLGKYIPVAMVQKNESLQRCITNESCYLLNMSKKSMSEQSACDRVTSFIDSYNKIVDSIPSEYEYQNI